MHGELVSIYSTENEDKKKATGVSFVDVRLDAPFAQLSDRVMNRLPTELSPACLVDVRTAPASVVVD